MWRCWKSRSNPGASQSNQRQLDGSAGARHWQERPVRTNASWEDISECRSRWSVGEEHKTRVGAWEAERPSRPGTASRRRILVERVRRMGRGTIQSNAFMLCSSNMRHTDEHAQQGSPTASIHAPRCIGYGSQRRRPALASDSALLRSSSLFSLKCTSGHLRYDGPD